MMPASIRQVLTNRLSGYSKLAFRYLNVHFSKQFAVVPVRMRGSQIRRNVLLLWSPIPAVVLFTFAECSDKNIEFSRIDSQMEKSTRNLLYAAVRNDAEKIKKLIRKGVDPNTRHALGWTALHVAAYHGNVEAVIALLGNGADINAVDEFILGDCSTMRARLRRQRIKFGGFDIATSRRACFPNRDLEWRQVFVVLTFRGMTALHYAVMMQHTDVVRVLIAYGANPEIKNEAGYYADEYAADDEIEAMMTAYTKGMNLEHRWPSSLEKHSSLTRFLLMTLRRVSRFTILSNEYVGIDDVSEVHEYLMRHCCAISFCVFCSVLIDCFL